MTPQALLYEAAQLGIELYPDGDTIRYRGPKPALADLKPKLAAHKAELLTLLQAEQDRVEALALLNRLKTFTLPAGRMPAVRMIAEACAARLVQSHDSEPVNEVDDPAFILAVLQEIEPELIALGGSPDPHLAEAITLVTGAFPDARLIEIKIPILAH
jgi:hypothetical protein